MFDAHAQKNILIVMLQIFDNLFHYKNTVTVQWIKRIKLCMVTMATLPPTKELKIQVVSWQNEIRTLDVLKSPTCREAAGSSLTGVTAFWSLSKQHLFWLSTGSTQEDPSLFN